MAGQIDPKDSACLKALNALQVFTINAKRTPKLHLIPYLDPSTIRIEFFRKQLYAFFARQHMANEVNNERTSQRRYFDVGILFICCHFMTLMEDSTNDFHIKISELKSLAAESENPQVCRFMLKFENLYNNISETCDRSERISRTERDAKNLVKQIFNQGNDLSSADSKAVAKFNDENRYESKFLAKA